MVEFEYGPVELYLIGFPGERPGPEIVNAILTLVESKTVKLLDLLFETRSQAGELTVLEVEEVADEYGLADLKGDQLGLAGSEDIDDLADAIEPGTSAALLLVEHLWVTDFAEPLYNAGGRVLHTERIPAPIVNEMVKVTSQ